MALIMLIPEASSFSTLLNYFSFSSWLFYGLTFSSVLVLRYKQPKRKRPFRVWIWVPVFCTICSLLLVIVPLIASPDFGYLVAALIILLGFVFYFPLIHYKKVPSGLDTLTSFLQQALELVPTSTDTDTE